MGEGRFCARMANGVKAPKTVIPTFNGEKSLVPAWLQAVYTAKETTKQQQHLKKYYLISLQKKSIVLQFNYTSYNEKFEKMYCQNNQLKF